MWTDLKALAVKYVQRYWPTEASFLHPSNSVRPKPVTGPLVRRLLYILPALPWVLGLLFVSAVAGLDLDGYRIVFQEARLGLVHNNQAIVQTITLGLPNTSLSINLDKTLLTVSASGLIGYVTNWLAITMLFQPRVRRPLLGQGFIPAQRIVVIDRLSRAITTHVVNAEHLKRHIQDSGLLHGSRQFTQKLIESIVADQEFRSDSQALARRFLEDMLAKDEIRAKIIQIAISSLREAPNPIGPAVKLYDNMNRASLENQFQKVLETLPGSVDAIWDELNVGLDQVPAHIDAAADEVEEWLTRVIMHLIGQLNMYDLIASNLAKLDAKEIESIIKSTARAELKYIRYLGGVLGAIGGLVILDARLLVPIVLGLGALVAVDSGLAWSERRRHARSDSVSM